MRLALLVTAAACASVGCQARQDPPAQVEAAPVVAPGSEPVEVEQVEVAESPGGHAALVYVDSTVDRVLLVAGGDTTEVFSWELSRSIGVEWLAPNLGRLWLPVGGNYVHESVFVEGSSGRTSPPIMNDVTVDAGAGTVLTFDFDGFTLRELWTGRELASWSPADLDLIELWQECAPSGTLDGRAATVRYDCGQGERVRAVGW